MKYGEVFFMEQDLEFPLFPEARHVEHSLLVLQERPKLLESKVPLSVVTDLLLTNRYRLRFCMMDWKGGRQPSAEFRGRCQCILQRHLAKLPFAKVRAYTEGTRFGVEASLEGGALSTPESIIQALRFESVWQRTPENLAPLISVDNWDAASALLGIVIRKRGWERRREWQLGDFLTITRRGVCAELIVRALIAHVLQRLQLAGGSADLIRMRAGDAIPLTEETSLCFTTPYNCELWRRKRRVTEFDGLVVCGEDGKDFLVLDATVSKRALEEKLQNEQKWQEHVQEALQGPKGSDEYRFERLHIVCTQEQRDCKYKKADMSHVLYLPSFSLLQGVSRAFEAACQQKGRQYRRFLEELCSAHEAQSPSPL
jgi:hypothetical protein